MLSGTPINKIFMNINCETCENNRTAELKIQEFNLCNYQIIEITFTFKECKTSAAWMTVKIQFLKYFIFK